MSLSTQAIGYLDITNAILRVGTLDVAGIQGVDAVTNVLKGNSVLLWDDQGSDMASPPFQLGAGAARSTSPPEIDLRNASGSNFMYAGLKLPNAWLCKFDLYLADTSTGNVHVQTYTESTTTYGDDGYQLIFDGANNTVTLEYDGAQIVQESVTLTTGDWETVVVSFNRGAWSVTYGDDVVLQIDDSERADVYDNPVTGQYFRMETDASTARKIRYFKITNNGPFLQANTNDISYVSGNVAIGHHATEYKLSVAGSANVGALDVQSNLEVGTANLFVDTLTGRIGVGTTEPEHALDVTGNVQVGTANLFVDTVNSRVGVGTTEPGYDLDVHGSANVGALTVSSVTSNLEVGTANLFVDTLTGRVGVGTSEPAKALEVTGTLRVTDGLSNVSDLSVVQDDLTVSSNVAVSGGGLELTQVSNVAQIKSSSNVVTEFVRSKKLIKYPRVALTSAASNAYENGYKITYSHQDSSNPAWKAFDNDPTDVAGWYSYHATGTYYNGTNGAYSGTTQLASETELGEWIGLEVPSPIKLYDVRIVAQDYSATTNTVDDFVIYAKKQSGDTWTRLGKFTGIAARQGTAAGVTVHVNSSDYYKFFALVATKRNQQATYGVTIRVLDFFGIPEYDPEADGTDVIARSVPNVPNTDWLEVYYDGQDYTSMPATVTDKSGNGVTGTPSGGVGFDTEYKAFTFDGVNDYMQGSVSGVSGDYIHSVSLWIKINATGLTVFEISGSLRAANKTIGLYIDPDGTLSYYFYDNDARYNTNLQIGQWYHIGLTYHGGGSRRLYVNGVQPTFKSAYGTLTNSLTLSATTLTIGNAPNFYGGYFNGSIANFRFFNRTLTGDEVWQLYAYQKEYFGHGNLGMTLKSGRLGIGTTEPRAVLDVRGDILYGCPVFFEVSTQNNTANATYMNFNLQTVSKGGGWSYSDYTRFYAPLAGYYKFDLTVMGTYTNGRGTWFSWRKNGSLYPNNSSAYVYDYQSAGVSVHLRVSGSTIVYLNVGDWFGIYNHSNTINEGWGKFTGFYLST